MFERIICTTTFPYMKCCDNGYKISLPTDAWSHILSFLPEDSYNVINKIIPIIPKKYFDTNYKNQVIFMPDFLLIAKIQDNIKIYYCLSEPVILIITRMVDNKKKLIRISKSSFRSAIYNRNCHYFNRHTRINLREQCKKWFLSNQQFFHYQTSM